jgi:hypothetical protein
VETQKLVNWACVCSVYLNLAEHLPAGTVAFSKLFNFSFGSWLLIAELVAGKSKNFETFVSKLLVDGDHLLVVLVSQTSLGGHVDNEYSLFPGNSFG